MDAPKHEHGFDLQREERVEEVNALARLYRHRRTGARLLSLIADDTNKVFGISFRTPPADSTGVAHILEHSVLCGSRKYPIKEPFVELLKGSLQTFLNAMTYPDKTCYPVASENRRDFYNLVDVYLDAVLHPRITREVFEQEGWHVELEAPDAEAAFKGVVYNEMKGVYSSPDDVLEEYAQQSLFPDTVYGVDSGGDPRRITDLTYERFAAFHRDHYHPSNAYAYFYGDDDPAERLRLLDGYFLHFDARPPAAAVPLQPPRPGVRRIEHTYEPGEEQRDDPRALLTVNWLLPEAADPDLCLAVSILGYALLGTPASPLRQALIESGLGEDVAGTGLAGHLRQMYLSTGLRGIRLEDAGRVEQLVLDTLARLAGEGLDPDILKAAVNTTEFRLRERNTGGYPRGLAYMVAALSFWLHDGDPLAGLRFEGPLAAAKRRLDEGGRYFADLVREHLVENPHRTVVLLRPEPGRAERDGAEERRRLEAERDRLGPAGRRELAERTRRLKELQETPDPPEALACIPMLRRQDLDRNVRRAPLAAETLAGAAALHNDLFTNGILYLDIGFDLHRLPAALLPYLPLFSRALTEMGTTREDYAALSNRIGQKTGGVWASTLSASMLQRPGAAAWLFVRAKCTIAQAGELADLLGDVLTLTRFDDRRRFGQILLEDKADFEAHLVPGGSSVVDTRLRAGFSAADWLTEQIKGVTNLFFLRELAERIKGDWPSVLAALESLRAALLHRGALLVHATVDEAAWREVAPRLAPLLDRLPAAGPEPAPWPEPPGPRAEGLTLPAQVNFVGKGADLYRHGYRLHGSAAAVVNHLRSSWLWERVRVVGGAYGAFCSLDHRSGVFSFGSYRDPNLRRTLEVYDAAGRFLREAAPDEREITRNIIGAIGSMDAYQLPDAKGYGALVRHLVGDSDERRQRFRDELLGATAGDFRAFADALDAVRDHGTVVVLGSAAALDRDPSALGAGAVRTPVL